MYLNFIPVEVDFGSIDKGVTRGSCHYSGVPLCGLCGRGGYLFTSLRASLPGSACRLWHLNTDPCLPGRLVGWA